MIVIFFFCFACFVRLCRMLKNRKVCFAKGKLIVRWIGSLLCLDNVICFTIIKTLNKTSMGSEVGATSRFESINTAIMPSFNQFFQINLLKFLFFLVSEDLMTHKEFKHGEKWNAVVPISERLKGLDFGDDVRLLSHNRTDKQERPTWAIFPENLHYKSLEPSAKLCCYTSVRTGKQHTIVTSILVFLNKRLRNLRHIIKIRWPNTIISEERALKVDETSKICGLELGEVGLR